jgi:hypothetical protein
LVDLGKAITELKERFLGLAMLSHGLQNGHEGLGGIVACAEEPDGILNECAGMREDLPGMPIQARAVLGREDMPQRLEGFFMCKEPFLERRDGKGVEPAHGLFHGCHRIEKDGWNL